METKRTKANIYLWDKKAGLLERNDKGYSFSYYRDYLFLQDAQSVSLTLPCWL